MAMEGDLGEQAYPSPSPAFPRIAASISTYKIRNRHNRKQHSGIKRLFRDFGDWAQPLPRKCWDGLVSLACAWP